ncbi:MAG: hypothetical protein KDB22_22625, partial [Planctomycetales bacterium]|nr:hypothetical protein [Planctomycetales bacterium]
MDQNRMAAALYRLGIPTRRMMAIAFAHASILPQLGFTTRCTATRRRRVILPGTGVVQLTG